MLDIFKKEGDGINIAARREGHAALTRAARRGRARGSFGETDADPVTLVHTREQR